MRVLVTGAGGQLGRDLVSVLSGGRPAGGTGLSWWSSAAPHRGVEVVGATHEELPVENRQAVASAFEGLRPEVVIHAAAFTAVDACEGDPDRAFAVNALGTRHVAEWCGRLGAHLLYVSTDYVFDGSADRPYNEWDVPDPRSVYGRSKWAGERECPPPATIVRTSWLWSTHGRNIVDTALRLAHEQRTLRFVDDQRGCPTFTADLAAAVAALALDRRPGVHHVTNQGATTWFGFVRAVVELAGLDPARVEPVATADLDPPRPAPRPANSVLDNAVLRLAELPLLPTWHDALERGMNAIGSRGDERGARGS